MLSQYRLVGCSMLYSGRSRMFRWNLLLPPSVLKCKAREYRAEQACAFLRAVTDLIPYSMTSQLKRLVSFLLFAAEFWVQFQGSPRGMYGVRSGPGEASRFPCHTDPFWLDTPRRGLVTLRCAPQSIPLDHFCWEGMGTPMTSWCRNIKY